MKSIRVVTVIIVLFVLTICLAGCGNKFFDPTQVGRFRPVPAVNVILESLGVAEETSPAWEGAEEPRPVDVVAYEADYILGRGDALRISIFELRQEGAPFMGDFIISDTGRISIPEVGVVEASGLTESELEKDIQDILSPTILKDPLVTVILLNSQQRVFSILGEGVRAPSRYPIPRYDFRLTEAIAMAGGVGQFNVSYIYVARRVTGRETISEIVEPPQPEQLMIPEQEMLEIIEPHAQLPVNQRMIITAAEMITDQELAEAALPEGFEPLADDSQAQKEQAEPSDRQTIDRPIEQEEADRIEWIFQDGRWVPVQVRPTRPRKGQVKPETEKIVVRKPEFEQLMPKEFGWDQVGTGGIQTRVIKIPVDKFLGGDPRYNIVIKPGDSIHIPVDIIGEYYIYGNTNRVGAIPLTGRPMTLKMAIAAAGGLGPLAWPKRCEVVRRLSKKEEEIVMVDLDKISSGEQPDFFIKPNDLINVGTHPTARWRAVLRNAFRATYGFGFIYDRNFADRDYGTSRPIPSFIEKIF